MAINVLRKEATMAEYKKILQVLEEVRFNKSRAAEVLGIDRKTLYNKLDKYKELQANG